MLTCVLALPRSCLPMTTSTTSQLLPPPSLPPLTTPTTTPTTTLSDITSSLKASHSRRTSLAGPPPLVTKNTNTPFLETSVRFHYNQFRWVNCVCARVCVYGRSIFVGCLFLWASLSQLVCTGGLMQKFFMLGVN
jgi:hypothetical protein